MHLPLLANAPGAGDGRSFPQVRETQLHTQPIPPTSPPHLCCAFSVELRPWRSIPITVVTPMARAGSATPTAGPLLGGRPSLIAANNSGRCRVVSDVAEHSHTAGALGHLPLFGAPAGSTCTVGGSGTTAPRGVVVGALDHGKEGVAPRGVLAGRPSVPHADVAASHSGRPRLSKECHNVADAAGHGLDARAWATPAPRRLHLCRDGQLCFVSNACFAKTLLFFAELSQISQPTKWPDGRGYFYLRAILDRAHPFSKCIYRNICDFCLTRE
ncbi:uncharacterized protein [Triticum aestivum]|uniref:uncharacterized protein isoform X1 n=1 Tax=Triticum aestivum TaxID=4565 RepID=UPI001D007ADE|nr:uncharacterized protein LOC123186396 isoform X1 [Triticum aestivum]